MHVPADGSHDRHEMVPYGRKSESAFPFFYEVFYLVPATVKLNNLMRFHLHRCNNECEKVHHLPIWFFNFKDHSPWMGPTAGLILELTVLHCIVDLIVTGGPLKSIINIFGIVFVDKDFRL